MAQIETTNSSKTSNIGFNSLFKGNDMTVLLTLRASNPALDQEDMYVLLLTYATKVPDLPLRNLIPHSSATNLHERVQLYTHPYCEVRIPNSVFRKPNSEFRTLFPTQNPKSPTLNSTFHLPPAQNPKPKSPQRIPNPKFPLPPNV